MCSQFHGRKRMRADKATPLMYSTPVCIADEQMNFLPSRTAMQVPSHYWVIWPVLLYRWREVREGGHTEVLPMIPEELAHARSRSSQDRTRSHCVSIRRANHYATGAFWYKLRWKGGASCRLPLCALGNDIETKPWSVKRKSVVNRTI